MNGHEEKAIKFLVGDQIFGSITRLAAEFKKDFDDGFQQGQLPFIGKYEDQPDDTALERFMPGQLAAQKLPAFNEEGLNVMQEQDPSQRTAQIEF
jgi:hypothetical protein